MLNFSVIPRINELWTFEDYMDLNEANGDVYYEKNILPLLHKIIHDDSSSQLEEQNQQSKNWW